MLVPLWLLVGALMLAVSVYSKNPKEAGLLLGNLMIFFFGSLYLPLINPGLERFYWCIYTMFQSGLCIQMPNIWQFRYFHSV